VAGSGGISELVSPPTERIGLLQSVDSTVINHRQVIDPIGSPRRLAGQMAATIQSWGGRVPQSSPIASQCVLNLA